MDRATHVLLLVENNGYPRDFRVRREAEALQGAGYRVSVIAPREAGQPWVERVASVDVYRFPAPPGGGGVLGYAFEFGYATAAMLALTCRIALRHRIDVIHAANPPDTLFVIGAAFKPFGTRFVFDHHDLAPEVYLSRFSRPRANLIHRCLRLLERCSYAVADVVIATNESYARRAIERGGKAPDRVFVVRNGPPAAYGPLPVDPTLAATAAHLVGYVGTIGPQDGLDCWLDAIAHLVFDHGRRDFLAIVIGDGDARKRVEALAHEMKIGDFVRFTGWLPEIEARRILSAVQVCVQPDPSNPLNDVSTMNKMMEYMALGKPTVAFDLLETRKTAGEAALYARPNDTREFAAHVAWLLDHADEARSIGNIGRERVHGGLQWEHSVPQLLQAYAEGLGRGPMSPSRRGRRAPTDAEQSNVVREPAG